MPKVSQSQLIGNYGASLVTKRLSSECLVRPVAADTDIGIDLYCESIDPSGEPFLHFWIQVKSGSSRIQEMPDGSSAKCSLRVEHIEYWGRQPVPVYVAMVPVAWPISTEPRIYLKDISALSILQDLPKQETVTVQSDLVWEVDDSDSVRSFLSDTVPKSDAFLECRQGMVAPVKSLRPDYVRAVPFVPAERYQDKILTQVRQTASMSILSMWNRRELNQLTAATRRRLREVVLLFTDSPHWEDLMAIAISAHADEDWELAKGYYQKTIDSIIGDAAFASSPGISGLLAEVRCQLERAQACQTP